MAGPKRQTKAKHRGAHERLRRLALGTLLASGRPAVCVYGCGRSMGADTSKWNLCHDEDGPGYMGVFPQHFGHESCNKGDPRRYDKIGGNPWSRAGKVARVAKAKAAAGDRLAQREAGRQARLSRRRIILPGDR